MDKNLLIKYLVKEISQELKKEIKNIIREEFNNISNKTQSRVLETSHNKEHRTTKVNSSLDSLLSKTTPFNSSDMDYGPSVISDSSNTVNRYTEEPLIDLDGKYVAPLSEGSNLMSKLLSKNYTAVLKQVEKMK